MLKPIPIQPEPLTVPRPDRLLVQTQGLTRRFVVDGQNLTALHETSVQVRPGDRIALLGVRLAAEQESALVTRITIQSIQNTPARCQDRAGDAVGPGQFLWGV